MDGITIISVAVGVVLGGLAMEAIRAGRRRRRLARLRAEMDALTAFWTVKEIIQRPDNFIAAVKGTSDAYRKVIVSMRAMGSKTGDDTRPEGLPT